MSAIRHTTEIQVNVPDGGVVIVHPARQHAYEVVLAAQRAGRLRQFITGIYYNPAAFPYALVPLLPRPLHDGAIRQLAKRANPAIAAERVRSWPYAEILSRTIGRIRWIDRLSRHRSGFVFANWATDLYASRVLARMSPRPAAVYGFFGSVVHTFSRARQLGIPTILDVPCLLGGDDIGREECRALGLKDSLPPSVDAARELGLSDWVVAPSPAVAESIRLAGFAGRGTFVVPFGADTDAFRPAAQPRGAARFRAVFAGRLEVRKGVHYLLDAWQRAGLDGELVIAGPPSSEQYLARIRQLYSGNVVEAGNLVQPQLAALFSTADVFVFPSLSEGSAVVVYEALASGLPCIVTAESGSVVRDGIEGFLVPSRNVAAICDRLQRLYHDPEMRQRMARAARVRASEFTWATYHHKIGSIIDHVLGHQRSQCG
ncbi:MAG: hypothetical protein A3F70_03725 [Acidobacteria bacterium RIFCSPLOWO2_12_FULL_67_14]|nr:MAG: hypothetical protein A3H29_15960 [Acidobacteria bacterium RIFCSPLOWO2_02_FULL_67_21]OFW40106.1 MAG: hypothetical protein A3F70_03725 [Acidobacteria bacterium RIFCSPLOWO2_12_FULL_67_14]